MAETPAGPRTTALRQVLSWHRPLVAFAAANALMVIIAAIGLGVDERVLGGAPIWLKPLKFAISFVLFSLTLAWMISLLRRHRRPANWLGTAVVATGVIEMVVIVGQVVRGQQSHFNTITQLDTLLWTTMGAAIVLLWIATLVVATLLVREPMADRVLSVGIRLGLVVALLGMAMAFFMTSPTAGQREALAQGQPSFVGAHSVGVPDGGPGLAVTGWSTIGGDLRVGHFIGMHALQAIPLLAVALGLLAVRWTRLREERVRTRLVAVAAGAWLGLTLLLTWQALRGQPLLSPDDLTLGVLAGLLLATVIGIVLALRSADRVTEPSAAP